MPTLNIASFNIRRDSIFDGRNAWLFRRDWVREILDRQKLDIVGVQEAKAHQVDFLAAGRFDYAGVGRDDGQRRGEFAPILYDRKRFKRHQSGTFWLSPTPDRASLGWDADNNRVCTWVYLEDRAADGRRFYVFNTHLDNKGIVAREQSITLILNRIRTIAGATPFFLTGDFNLRPRSPGINRLSTELRNSRLVTETRAAGPDGTANGFDISRPLDTRIDYIFVSPTVRVLRYAVIKEIRNGRYPSDHLPVVIAAEVGRKPLPGKTNAIPIPGKSTLSLPRR
jgi:endonuclease/exonuclease/phosphatase family metal-dependent hydrolase